MAINKECATCRFWVQCEDSARLGECRRNPPVVHDKLLHASVFGVGNLYGASMWPATIQTDWCGDYRQKTF